MMNIVKKCLLAGLSLLVISLPAFSAVILNEDFSEGPSDYTTGNYTYSSGNTWELTAIQGENDARFQLDTNASIISPAVNTVGTVSFKYKEGDSGGGNFQVLISVDGGSFTELDEQTFSGTSFSNYSLTVNNLSDNCRIKVLANAGSQLIIDDFEITDYVEGAELNTNTSALTGFLYYEGEGPSSSKYFELSGSLLTGYPGDITVAAPANYEISPDDVSFSNSLTVPYSSASLPATTIYVRLKSGLALGDYNESITISGGGADDIFVSCSGSVTEMPPPEIYVVPDNLSGFSYVTGTGPSDYQTYQLYGNYLTDYPNAISVNAPSNYEISLDNASYSTSLSVTYDSYTLPSTTIYVRLKSGLAVGNYNNENITNVSSNYGTETVTCSGTVEDLPPDPTLYVTPTSLSGFSYIVGNGPSAEQSYALSGANLTGYSGNITVTAPTNYEVSLNAGSGYVSNLDVAYSSETLSSTTIYVRLKAGLAVGDYSAEIISNEGGGASAVDVECTGAVEEVPPPELSVSPSSLDGFTYVEGNGPSEYQSFTLSGSYLTGYPDNITLSAPENYEISLNAGSGYSSEINVPYDSGTLNPTTVYVRLLSGLSIGTYNNELISVTGGGASEETVACHGDVTDVPPPVLNVTPTNLDGFSYTEGNGPSGEQSYALSGDYLTGYPDYITITAPDDYEISLSSGTGFTTSLSIEYTSSVLSATTMYVRMKSGLAAGDYNDEAITHNGGGAAEVILTCSGSVMPESTDPCLYEDFSGFTDGAHGSPASVDLSSSMDDYTLVPGWDGYKVFSAGGEVKLGSSSYNGYVITPEVDMSAGGSMSFDYAAYGSDNAQVQVFFAADGVDFTQLGNDITPTSEFQTHSIDVPAGTASSRLKIGTDNKRIYLDNVEVYCGGSPVPELQVNPDVLSDFNYVESNGPSAEQSFTLSGSDLDGTDVTIAPSENYEVSVGSGYQSVPIVLSAYDGDNVSVNVRLKAGLVSGDYNSEIISVSGGGADDVSVTCSGYVDDNVGNDLPDALSCTIYPNPVKNLLSIEVSSGCNEFSWQIVDLAGKLLNEGNASDKTVVDFSAFEDGVYFVRLRFGSHVLVEKVMKQ